MKEIWKEIDGYVDYLVSNLGRVKSKEKYVNSKFGLRRRLEKILKPIVGKDGYLETTLFRDKKPKRIGIHRLVMIVFNPIENMQELEVNHIDHVKTNNYL